MNKNKLLNLITKEQLIKDFSTLGSVTRIANTYKVNPITVYSAFKICGIDIVKPHLGQFLTKEKLEEAYAELGNLNAVGARFSLTGETIKVYMKKFKIPYKPRNLYTCNHNIFSEESENSFYVAGFIAADGCVMQRGGKGNSCCLKIALSTRDEEFLVNLKNLMEYDGPIKYTIAKNSKRNPEWNDSRKAGLDITSAQMFKDLAKFNVVPRKTLTYTFPEWIINHPLCHHFIRGYNDGDGSFFYSLSKERKTKQLMFSLRGNVLFLETVRSILEEKCDLSVRNKPIRISSKHGTLEYGGNVLVPKIVDYLYRDATIFLPRKKEIAFAPGNIVVP